MVCAVGQEIFFRQDMPTSASVGLCVNASAKFFCHSTFTSEHPQTSYSCMRLMPRITKHSLIFTFFICNVPFFAIFLLIILCENSH